ncbi:MAG TPA: hypothetical protein PKH77_18780 [Anaerolineae bacterium]|nr:hypothetical protein [Anaerolineae bacterium]
MILTFPYYDPTGAHNEVFARQLPTLQSAFAAICISAVPPTATENCGFVHYLEEQGCSISHNAPNSAFGVHAREALRLSLAHASEQTPIFFGFLDRILFALDTDWRDVFLRDLRTYAAAPFVAFARSAVAWDTHPAHYREIEQMMSRLLELLCGRFLDLSPAAMILSAATADVLLNQSTTASYAVWAEWVLLALKNRIPLTTPAVDWLAWEHPYWENVLPDVLKQARDASFVETQKRIQWNATVMSLLAEERFSDLCEAVV